MTPDLGLRSQTASAKFALRNSDLETPGPWLKSEVRGLGPLLLQYYLVPFLQPAEHFCLGSIGDSNVDSKFLLTLFGLRVRDLYRRLFVLVIQDGAFGDLQHVLVFFQDDFRVGGHLGLQLATWILDRNAHLEGRDIIFLHAHGRNLRHLTVEGLVFEGFDFDPSPLSEINLANIALVH